MIEISRLREIKRLISLSFYEDRIDLFRILYNLNKLLERIEEDLNYQLPNVYIDSPQAKCISIKIFKDCVELKFFKAVATSSYIYNIRFYKGYYCINNNKNKASYKDLLKFIDSFYNIKQRSLAYSLDTLCPGLYIWFFNKYIIFGGDICPANYNYVIPTKFGFGFVFPNLDHWHTPFKQFEKVT